jgi:uncharacterized protein (DUF983 family)
MNDFRRLMRLLARAALLRCPACGRPTFAKGLLSTHKACRVCGLLFEHDDGFFLGAVVVGYMITFLIGILPSVVLVATGRWSGVTGTVVAIVLCLTLPVLPKRSGWRSITGSCRAIYGRLSRAAPRCTIASLPPIRRSPLRSVSGWKRRWQTWKANALPTVPAAARQR